MLVSLCFVNSLSIFFIQHFGWARRDAILLAFASTQICAAIIIYFVFQIYNSRNPKLLIERRGQTEVSTARRFEVWMSKRSKEGAIGFFLFVMLFLINLLLALNSSQLADRIFGVAFSLIFFIGAWRSVSWWRHPLVLLTGNAATIRRQQIGWARVQSVKCERHAILFADLAAVRLTFRDERKKKMATVVLPSSQHHPLKEKELFEFISLRLGHPPQRLVFPDSDSL